MRCRVRLVLMLAGLTLALRSGALEAGSLTFEEKRPERSTSQLDVGRAEVQWRRIGILAPWRSTCPEIPGGGWKVESFRDLVEAEIKRTVSQGPFAGQQLDLKPLLDLKLNRTCVYTATTADLTFSPPAKAFLKVAPDRMAVTITSAGGVPSDQLSRAIWPHLAEQFRTQTHQVAVTAGPALQLQSETPRVRLTFLDSQPDGVWPPTPAEGSKHGFTLVHMAHSLVCPAGEACAAEIATRRVLAYRNFDPDTPPSLEKPAGGEVSGHLGLLSNLTTAIYAEVLYWRQFEPEKKLILNLSLGWDGEAFGDLDARCVGKLDPAPRGVYEALRFARRSGALVLAAAGNQRGNEETRWPLLPAAWELRRPNLFRWGFWKKPVYALGGVDWQGQAIPNSRRGGIPRRVAYADHSVIGTGVLAATGDPSAEAPTALYTGTSVSTAVTSAIAAMVWHLRPDLKPKELMALVTQAGEPLPIRADYHLWKPLSRGPFARRVSLCSAVQAACGQDHPCSALAVAPSCSPWEPAQTADLWPLIRGLSDRQGELNPHPVRSPRVLLDAQSQRWLFPQPEATPCPGCTVVRRPPPETELLLQIGEDWNREANTPTNPFQISGGNLHIECRTGASYDFPLDPTLFQHLPTAAAGPVFTIPLRRELPRFGCTAQITFLVTEGKKTTSVINPVALSPY